MQYKTLDISYKHSMTVETCILFYETLIQFTENIGWLTILSNMFVPKT